ncbi:MAG: proton-conducting transporter membrane subunit [Parvibaculaceae bacterium]|nr:proton-conducting transporter membrane subunit [Parvibaculaceae bacterium]
MDMLFQSLSPAFIYLAAALVLPLSPNGRVRALVLLAVPVAAFASFAAMPYGEYGQIRFLGLALTLFRLDALSWLFGLAFSIAAFLALLYALHLRDSVQQAATLIYAGAATGAVFAGDLVTLFIFWEATALSSVLLIWAKGGEASYKAGMRYLVVQVGSGVLLFAGLAMLWRETGSLAFEAMTLESLATWTILAAFAIKAAFPLLGGWLADAYPRSTVTGAVTLAAFTTKLAIYALARGFPGCDILIPVGVAMALLPLPYALGADDLRKSLAYLLNSQLGFMVVGIGIGTPLAINGAVGHAFAHIIYDGLMFMALGAVLAGAGTIKESELGGLCKTMPWTAGFILIGALSFAALPLTSGFVTKSLTFSAATPLVQDLLYAASAGVFMAAVMKTGRVFFTGTPVISAEAPLAMRFAMGLSALLSLGIGLVPGLLYRLLPFDTPYQPYSLHPVLMQLLASGAGCLIWLALAKLGWLPHELPGMPWLCRKAGTTGAAIADAAKRPWARFARWRKRLLDTGLSRTFRMAGPDGPLARTLPVGSMALWVVVLLGVTLLLTYL